MEFAETVLMGLMTPGRPARPQEFFVLKGKLGEEMEKHC